MRGLRSASGDATTTKRDHTARWDAFHRPSSQRVTASKQYQPKRSFNLATTALRTNGWYRLRGQVNMNNQQDSNTALFWQSFVGLAPNFTWMKGRSGDTHHPPNADSDYDYQNPTPVLSDIEDWTPAGTGQKKDVSATTWGGIPYGWPGGSADVPQLTESQWYIYWMQAMPGYGNTIPYGSNRMSNWWRFTADWDASAAVGLGLYEPGTCSFTVAPSATAFTGLGGSASVAVSAAGCKWIAVSNAPWLHIISGNTSAGGNS